MSTNIAERKVGMGKVRYEEMLPHEVVAARQEKPLA